MDLIKDTSVLTTIPEKDIKALLEKYVWCIYDNVLEQHINNDIVNIELLIGNLYIKIEDDIVKYKFIPNNEFNSNVLNSLKNKNPLKQRLIKTLKDKICNTYKDMF